MSTPFDATPVCSKCLASGGDIKRVFSLSTLPKNHKDYHEWLQCKCLNCGYTFEMEVADAAGSRAKEGK